jgi:CRP-like cAMP-binding protein
MAKRASAHQLIERSVPYVPPAPDFSQESMFAWMQRASQCLRYAADTMIHAPEQENDALYLIQKGQVEFSHIRPDGAPHRWNLLYPSDFFGELRLQPTPPGQPYIAQTLEESTLWKLDRTHFLKLFGQKPEALREIISIIGHKQDLLFCFRS